MNYDVYFNGCVPEYDISLAGDLANAIKAAEEEDKFIFMLTTTNEGKFKVWVHRFGLEDFIVFHMKEFVINHTYRDQKPRLKLVVMGKQPIIEGEYGKQTNVYGKTGSATVGGTPVTTGPSEKV